MGKKQHQSDRLYLSNKEWKELGGFKQASNDPTEQRVPFDHCALTFTPWTTPVCDRDGNIFDLMSATHSTTHTRQQCGQHGSEWASKADTAETSCGHKSHSQNPNQAVPIQEAYSPHSHQLLHCFCPLCRHIIPYIQQHHTNPITSTPLHLRDLIRLHFATDPSNSTQYICPVSHKPFSPLHTHIVAIATTGNVYAADVVDELCVKAGVWEDLVSGERFRKEDIITLQDPHNLKTRSVQRSVEAETAVEQKQLSGPAKALTSSAGQSAAAAASSISTSSSSSSAPFVARGAHSSHHATASFTSTALTPVTANTRRALTDAEKREQQYAAIRKQKSTKAYARLLTKYGSALLLGRSAAAAASSISTSSSSSSAPFVARGAHSSHHATASFTSTALTPVTANTRRALTDAEKREQQYAAIRKQKSTKAYARLLTKYGPINLTLYASQAPHTTHNFLTLATRGYYDNTASHRLLAGFMVQFGDPTGTGRGGEGAFERKFDDELVPPLKHDRRGVLSMANSGANTNSSQFFITFAACPHLDGKHTVFGHVVGGMQALDAMEKAGDRGDSDDKKSGKQGSSGTVERVSIERVEVYENPFKDEWVAKDAVTGEREDELEKRAAQQKQQQHDSERKAWFTRPVAVDRDIESKEVGHLIDASESGGGSESGSRKRKDGPVMPAPVNDEEEAVRQLKKRQAVSRALAASRPGASHFDFNSW